MSSRIYPKFVARYLFGRRIGQTLMVDTATERGMRGKSLDGMSVAGTLQGTNIDVRTGKVDGGWQLTPNRVKGDVTDTLIAEQALKEYVRENSRGQALLDLATMLGLYSEAELRARVERRLLDPNWHKKVDENDQNVIDLEMLVTAAWAAKHPIRHGEQEKEE